MSKGPVAYYIRFYAINLPNSLACCGLFTSTMLSATGRAYTMLRQIEWCYSETCLESYHSIYLTFYQYSHIQHCTVESMQADRDMNPRAFPSSRALCKKVLHIGSDRRWKSERFGEPGRGWIKFIVCWCLQSVYCCTTNGVVSHTQLTLRVKWSDHHNVVVISFLLQIDSWLQYVKVVYHRC